MSSPTVKKKVPGLETGARRTAFETFFAVLKNSPAFSNGKIVRSWNIWNQPGPIPEPQPSQMPAVTLRLLGGGIERLATVDTAGGLAEVDIRTRPTVVVETWVAGCDAGDAMDLYDALDNALFPANPAQRSKIRDALAEVGVSDWMPLRDVLPETLSDYGDTSTHSVGAYELTLDLTQ